MRFDYNLTDDNTVLVRYIRSLTDRIEPPTTRPIGTLAHGDAAGRHGRRHARLQPDGDQRGARSRTTGSPRTRQATSGLENSDYGINVPQNVETARGLANIDVTGFFSLGDAQQPFVERLNEVFAVHRRLHLDARPAFVQVRRRGAAPAHVHRVREPAERRLHVHRRCDAAHRQRRRRLSARPAVAVPPHDHEHAAGRARLALRRLRAGRVPAACRT